MFSKSHFLSALGIATAVILFIAVLYLIETRGWDLPVKTEYSPSLKVKQSNINEITLRVLSSWDGASVFTITLRKDGSAKYVGVRNVERIGVFQGKTGEFPALAGWIQSLNLKPFHEKCYDNEVRLTLVSHDLAEYITCEPNQRGIEFREALQAIEKVGSRIKWQKQQ